jgi:hypothetical protein
MKAGFRNFEDFWGKYKKFGTFDPKDSRSPRENTIVNEPLRINRLRNPLIQSELSTVRVIKIALLEHFKHRLHFNGTMYKIVKIDSAILIAVTMEQCIENFPV